MHAKVKRQNKIFMLLLYCLLYAMYLHSIYQVDSIIHLYPYRILRNSRSAATPACSVWRPGPPGWGTPSPWWCCVSSTSCPSSSSPWSTHRCRPGPGPASECWLHLIVFCTDFELPGEEFWAGSGHKEEGEGAEAEQEDDLRPLNHRHHLCGEWTL